MASKSSAMVATDQFSKIDGKLSTLETLSAECGALLAKTAIMQKTAGTAACMTVQFPSKRRSKNNLL